MRLVTESGLWVTGPSVAPVPLAAVLELDGAVLAWTVDEAADAPPQITFTDPGRADWLWRVLGEDGHRALAAAISTCAVSEPRIMQMPASSSSSQPPAKRQVICWMA